MIDRPVAMQSPLKKRRIGVEVRGIQTRIFDNAHTIKGHSKRDHRHIFENEAQEINFDSPKELIDELMKLIEGNWRILDEIKRS